MKLYNVEIQNLKNEFLIKGRKSCESAIKFVKIFSYCMVGIFLLFLIYALFSEYTLKDIGIMVAVSLVFFVPWGILANVFIKQNIKGIQECDEEIKKRLQRKKISQKYVSDILNKDKEEKKEKGFFIIAIAIIIVVIVIGVKACDLITSGSGNDAFDKNPNEWNENDKEYVNNLFDWIDKNN